MNLSSSKIEIEDDNSAFITSAAKIERNFRNSVVED